MRDAVDDGKVTIYQTDYATGRIVGTLGAFEANPAIVAALRSRPEQYMAGVVGPDAYPDLMTGQQVIHPGTNPAFLGDPAHNEPASVAGTDAWLTYLWRLAYGRRDANVEAVRNALNQGPLGEVAPPNDTPEIRAFVAGYMTHAAGDMFMHTFVNHYAGGDFALQPDPRNAIKHVVLEGYVGKRTPDTHARTSIEGVDRFIYSYMVRAYPGSVLEERLLRGGTGASVPYIFSTLRNGLQRDVDRYDRERLERRGPARVAYATANGPVAEYKRAWIKDIDDGLRAWPSVSHRLSLALVYNPDGDGMNVDEAKAIASGYVSDHLLSMAGLPDAAIATAQFISGVIDGILPDFMLAPLEALKRELLDWLVRQATGMSVDELKSYLQSPETTFDRVMNSPGGGYGGRNSTQVTLAEFNRSVLGIDDPGSRQMDRRFEVDRFAPAFNTVQMTKLMFLSERGMNDLLAALRAKGLSVPALPAGVPYENAMLGFLTSMDGDNRWQGLAAGSARPSGQAFFLARDRADAWRNLFMRQIGERADWPGSSAPAQTSGAPDDAGFERIEQWAARVDSVSRSGSGAVTVAMTFRNEDGVPHTLSNRLTQPLRATLDVGAGAPVAATRMEYVNPDPLNQPQWHYPPYDMVPRRGRVSVRFVFDAGTAARAAQARSLRVYEQRPRSPLTPMQMVDGPFRDFFIPAAAAEATNPAPAPAPGAERVDPAELARLAGRYRTNRGTILELRVEGQELVGEAITISRPSPAELVRVRLEAGRLRGTMRTNFNPEVFVWFNVDLAVEADASGFAGPASYVHGSGNPPITYSARRIIANPADGGHASGAGTDRAGFRETPYILMRADTIAAGGQAGAETVEVGLTFLNPAAVRKSVMQTGYDYRLALSDGREVRWDGNYYGESGADRLRNTLWLQQDDRAHVTFVFPTAAGANAAVRLSVRDGTREVASFDLAGLPERRGGGAEAGGGPVATGPAVLPGLEASLDELLRDEAGEWDALISVRNTGTAPFRLGPNALEFALYGQDGQARHRDGDYYHPAPGRRRVMPSGRLLQPGETLKLRLHVPESSAMSPTRYRVRGGAGEWQERSLPVP